MNVFVHPERAGGLLLPVRPRARTARTAGVWALDGRRQPVLVCRKLGEGDCTGLLLTVPEPLLLALDMAFAGRGIARMTITVVQALQGQPAIAWALPSERVARMFQYRLRA